MDCRDALTGRLYVCPCLLVIHKSTKVTGDVANHLSPAGGGLRGWRALKYGIPEWLKIPSLRVQSLVEKFVPMRIQGSNPYG